MNYVINSKELKERISAKEVARIYLGEPKKVIGKNAYYQSPFRDTFSGTPFVVTDDYMVDNGGDFKGDIIAFVQRIEDVQTKGALKIIADEFNVENLTDLLNEKNLITEEKESVKREKIVLEQGNNAVSDIKTMLDIVPFKKKPKDVEISQIKERIPTLKMSTYSLPVIIDNISHGYTCIPSGIKGEANKYWKEQQIFMVDIDNTEKVDGKIQKILSRNPRHITWEKAVEYCESIGLLPTFIYRTLSDTKECNKLRLVYVLESPITDIEVATGIYNFLKESLKPLNIDEAPTQLESMFFGGKSIPYKSEIYYSAVKKEIVEENVTYVLHEDFGKYNTYVEKLPKLGYGIHDKKLCRVLEKRDRSGNVVKSYVPISNFLTIISKQITFENGRDVTTQYVIKGLLLDGNKELPEQIVSKEELEKRKLFYK